MNEYKEKKATDILLNCIKENAHHSLESNTDQYKYKKYLHRLIGMKYDLKGSLSERNGREFLSSDEKDKLLDEYESMGLDREILEYFIKIAVEGKRIIG